MVKFIRLITALSVTAAIASPVIPDLDGGQAPLCHANPDDLSTAATPPLLPTINTVLEGFDRASCKVSKGQYNLQADVCYDWPFRSLNLEYASCGQGKSRALAPPRPPSHLLF
jgi:hypothetical protein